MGPGEVDFIVTENLKPIRFIEAKWSDAPIPKALIYMIKKFSGTEGYQIHFSEKKDFMSPEGIRVMPGAIAESPLSAIIKVWNSSS